MEVDIENLFSRFCEELAAAQTEDDLYKLKSTYLGKQGPVAELLKTLPQLAKEERPAFGQKVNIVKERIQAGFDSRLAQFMEDLRQKTLGKESLDISLKGKKNPVGHEHPVSLVLKEMVDIFSLLGFSVHEGPEIEEDFFNFEALNISADHPARDMHDTFYTGGGGGGAPFLLRTHTSPVQIHVMTEKKPPIRMIAPGVVYRRDSDMTHTPMFHQVEGLVVGDRVTFSELKGTVEFFFSRFFGRKIRLRFRSSYFPFTEPSAEVDMEFSDPRKNNRKVWLEVMGCGMVHPEVFRRVGYDADKMSGFAFGMGVERLAMIKWGIPDLRLFFENDSRFLRQFG